jgi:hypothetical protein
MVAVAGRCLQICGSDYFLCFIDCTKLQALNFLFQQTFLLIHVLFADSYNVYDVFIFYINSHFIFLHKTAIFSFLYDHFYIRLINYVRYTLYAICLIWLSLCVLCPVLQMFSSVPYLYVWQSSYLSNCIPLCEYGSDLMGGYFFVWLSNDIRIRSFRYYIYVCILK